MSRKYGQRGYQEDDREERPQPKKPGEGPREPRHAMSKPRGRGLGRPTATVFRCAVCGFQQSDNIGHESTCGKCKADLHTCTHCAFFDPGATHQCRKPITEPVGSKAKRNECELFEARTTQEFAKESSSSGGSTSKGKEAFDALFKI